MSLFCLCIVENMDKESGIFSHTRKIEMLAENYKLGVKYEVDWQEPIVSYIKNNSLIINVLDCPENDNCEMFLLPDNWYCNGRTNKSPFKERIKFLQDVSDIFINEKYSINFYLGQSGTNSDEFLDVTLKNDELADYLASTIGIYGIEDGVHISIVP